MIKQTIFLIFIFWIAGCRTGGVILRDSTASLTELKQAIVEAVGQPKKAQDEGREIITDFHDRNFEEVKEGAKERYYSRISILGDRRPYDVQVEVFIEKKVAAKKYELIGEDIKLADKLSKKIKAMLNQSRENKNMIDDFRPY